MEPKQAATGPQTAASAVRVIAGALALGVTFDPLVRGRLAGAGSVVFATMVAGALITARRPVRAEAVALLLGAWSLAAWLMIHSAGYLIALNLVAATLLLSAAASATAYDRRIWLWRLRDHARAWIDQLAQLVVGAAAPLKIAYRESRAVRLGGGLPYLRGLLIAIPIIAVFALLLASADALFSDFLGDALAGVNLPLGPASEHTAWIAACAWVAGGFLTFTVAASQPPAAGARGGRTDDGPFARPGDASSRGARIGYVEVMIVLGSVTGLFALFVGFQFAYLFRGAQQIALPGVTYAEYARAGFFQLLAVAVLTVGLVWGALHLAPAGSSRKRAAFVIVCAVMIVLAGVILVSAHKRLGLYEDAYGFTRLRLLSQVFAWWIASVLGLLLAQVFVARRHLFLPGCVVAGYVALMSLNALNPDAYITARNLSRAGALTQDGRRDTRPEIRYTLGLSADAVPATAARYRLPAIGRRRPIDASVAAWYCASISLHTGRAEWNASRARAKRALREAGFDIERECGDRGRADTGRANYIRKNSPHKAKWLMKST